MKRFTDTCKWDDPWFRALTGIQKLIFLYVIDRCNNAGFWEKDDDSLAFHAKLTAEQIEEAWHGLNRGLITAGGWVWVRRFLRHQKNENLSSENPAHKQIIALLGEQQERFAKVDEFSPFLAPYLGLLSPIGIGIGKGDGKKGSAEGKSKHRENAKILLEYLNGAACKKFRAVEAHLASIEARLAEPGVTPEDVEVMIDRQVKLWKGTDFEKYLQPSTLFNKTKFAGYYDARNEATTGSQAPKTEERLYQ